MNTNSIESDPIIVCLTPVKNEAWILDHFLQATSLWADYIIIADQQSIDGSPDIARKYNKVILIENEGTQYDEASRQKLLIDEARKIPGKKLLIALDADEFFTSDFRGSEDWKKIIHSPKGSTFGFRWLNIKPGFKKGWIPSYYLPFGKMDNGESHSGKQIHSARVPVKSQDEIIPVNDFQVMHFQYVDWKRMESKHRYYQCLETEMYPEKNAVEIFRMYHHMYHLPKREMFTLKPWLFQEYEKNNIRLTNFRFETKYWFDDKVIELLKNKGSANFRYLDIWNIQWNILSQNPNFCFKNPQSMLDRIAIEWLRFTQKFKDKNWVKAGDRIIKYKLWMKKA